MRLYGFTDMDTSSAPSTTSRLLALVLGPAYLLFLARVLGETTHTPVAIAVALTAVGSVAVMAVLTLLGVKAYEYRHSTIRFTLSTAFLVAIPLCVYLAFLRVVFRGQLTLQPDWLDWLLISAFAAFWMSATTVLLLWFAEAIMWLAVSVRRWLSSIRRTDGRLQIRNPRLDGSGRHGR